MSLAGWLAAQPCHALYSDRCTGEHADDHCASIGWHALYTWDAWLKILQSVACFAVEQISCHTDVDKDHSCVIGAGLGLMMQQLELQLPQQLLLNA